MACQRCLEHRKRMLEAAKARDLKKLAKLSATGVAALMHSATPSHADVRHSSPTTGGRIDGKPGT